MASRSRKPAKRRAAKALSPLAAAQAAYQQALEQQTATAEILRIIASRPENPDAVFAAITRAGRRLLPGTRVALFVARDGQQHYVSHSGIPESERLQVAQFFPRPLDRSQVSGAAIVDRKAVHVPDIRRLRRRFPVSRRIGPSAGHRALLAVPLLRGDEAIGSLLVARVTAGPFSKAQIELVKTFANQAVIAIENARLFNQTNEALEQQTAISDILGAISRSPAELQVVFDSILAHALTLCEGDVAVLWRYDDSRLHVAADKNTSVSGLAYLKEHPLELGGYNPTPRAALERRIIQEVDVFANPQYRPLVPKGSTVDAHSSSTVIAVPLLKEDALLGVITIWRFEKRAFTEKQVALLKTFADQAAIAIENVRLFNETREALERQTATSEVLRVISRSTSDVQPVFEAIAESSVRLLRGWSGIVWRVDGEHLRVAAAAGGLPGSGELARQLLDNSQPVIDGTFVAEALRERRPTQLLDAEADGVHPVLRETARIRGWRSNVAVPLLQAEKPVGVITLSRVAPGGFTAAEVELLQTFAEQAVIAIENVRLFNETKEALERQTATADVLRVISASPTDVKPVFDAILQSAVRLCGAQLAAAFRYDGKRVHMTATHNWPPEALEYFSRVYPCAPDPALMSGRAILERSIVIVPDAVADPHYDATSTATGHWRRMIGVPMLREGNPLGVLVVSWREPGETPQRQVDLLKTFADQAVIAIENVRLFNETKEALERQTAIGEVLRVISNSPTDVAPVLSAVASRAARICEASDARIWLVDGTNARHVAGFGDVPMPVELGHTIPIDRGTASGRAIVDRAAVQVEDMAAVLDEFPGARELQKRSGYRSILAVPLLREDRALGAIMLRRLQVRPFDEKQITLLKTFADQAAIAIENVRLFNETKEALEQQIATAEILSVISGTPTDTQPVFDAIARSALRIFGGMDVSVGLVDGDAIEIRAGTLPSAQKGLAMRIPVSRDSCAGRVILERAAFNIADIESPDTPPLTRERGRITGWRSIAIVPMLREGVPIGHIGVHRAQPAALTDKQFALLRTFADQAVIAIENVRLFNETKEALERQTATSDILQVIGRSISDTQPVFDAIVRNCAMLFAGSRVALFLLGGETVLCRSSNGYIPEPFPLDRQSAIGACILEAQVLHLPDLEAAAERHPRIRALGLKHAYRSGLFAPLIREGKAIGAVSVLRQEAGAFADKDVGLLTTFASQAVIAIENVRLFNETKEALERQTAIGEVLRVISGSPTDVEPVLDAVSLRAARICEASDAHIFLREDEGLRLAAGFGDVPSTMKIGESIPLNRASVVGRAVVDQAPVHIEDLKAAPKEELWVSKAFQEKVGHRTMLAVPLMREDRALGAIVLRRMEVKPFSDQQIALLRTFADQAAIAIENVRLFREIQEKSRQLEEASKHKSQFLASMSHELRTPLNAILGFNEMLLGGIYGDVPADMTEPLKDMQTSGKHLLRLINNVLDLAKIEAGRMELALADYSVQDTVAGVQATLRPLAAEKGLDFVTRVPEDIPLARGDAGRLTQCLMNLAGNSLKFTKSGKVEIAVAQDNGLLRYTVSDTGMGIPPEKIGSLFTEFKQSDATIASEYGGTGLGLSITKKFIEMHGGRIWVDSEPGKGSSFSFELPLKVSA
jgi:GAF domain-containing protein